MLVSSEELGGYLLFLDLVLCLDSTFHRTKKGCEEWFRGVGNERSDRQQIAGVGHIRLYSAEWVRSIWVNLLTGCKICVTPLPTTGLEVESEPVVIASAPTVVYAPDRGCWCMQHFEDRRSVFCDYIRPSQRCRVSEPHVRL